VQKLVCRDMEQFPWKKADQNGFVEIDERDTPYYKFLSSTQRDSTGTISAQTGNKEIIPPPEISSNIFEPRKQSKNSIFEMNHKINKPVTQMTREELEAFKRDLHVSKPCVPQDHSSKTFFDSESVTVPMFSSLNKQPSSISIIIPPSPLPEPAFLTIDTSGTQNILKESLYPKSSIYLTYIPIAKNFLGQGQYSQVYKGTYTHKDSNIEYPCAVKVIKKNVEAQTFAMSESYILSQLSHPSVITLIHTRDENGMEPEELQNEIQKAFLGHHSSTSIAIVLVLEYCPNGNIWDWMKKYPSSVSKKLWLKWARELASGIELIHSMGIIHHDLKPHNLLVPKFNVAYVSTRSENQ
jgi:hypothetical protein